MVFVSLGMWISTQSASVRPRRDVVLPGNVDWNGAYVMRLTAPGVDVRTNITFAGQWLDRDGRIVAIGWLRVLGAMSLVLVIGRLCWLGYN